MKKFEIPVAFKSDLITRIKESRKVSDPRKKDFTPSVLSFGKLKILLPRHFGFCYGVENAIEIAYKVLNENPGKKIYLLSEMIHNPDVNRDLKDNGIEFILDTYGNNYIAWENLKSEDIVILPAFGTSPEIIQKLADIGIRTEGYDTVCPFVVKVWNRSQEIGTKGYSVIVHGKPKHEETRSTFSRAALSGPALMITDLGEAKILSAFIMDKLSPDEFMEYFKDRYSDGFDPAIHLEKIGIVNQTTMIAGETQEIAEYLKNVLIEKYGNENLKDHFADTRDTLCYATNDNQTAAVNLLDSGADFAVVAGGYNSSNTIGLIKILKKRMPVYFVRDAASVMPDMSIKHYDLEVKDETISKLFMKPGREYKVIVNGGASCPDIVLEGIIRKLAELAGESITDTD
ncbi:MAG: 4-hydroxy-3-methylbut-2-enyl diphosphate reductase [Ignavibacteriales bacterium]|nr:4-hydroxy-3-methylbut-2-enyl diphosphate reductase [Ignavibacteriales bacterium]MCF8305730.1 4-hydroxy-3-methylbut-2-enyl diphosphate reductase [Ignavibacteriales bacterium]MCF8315452.1 4-hydroxy-3-methylbut-2-enyl diphosphate reductase [Ignavibacteriales bacterium]MCF8437020.1 4-hydroxy-3-methylbut-2-enyl diphosphate reductase [Ignavibacteriales bacterium]